MKRPRLKVVLPLLAALFLAAALAAPRVRVDHFSGPLRAALERALDRQVEIGEVRLHLLTGPGFTMSDVVIRDHPSSGLEPVAYVTSLEARLGWRSLLGRLEFSSLRLVEPSVNLARVGEEWNFQPLIQASLGPAGQRSRLPRIEVRGGRLNFKFGTLKSPFYLMNVDLDLSPAAVNQFDLRFSGEPARTDRSSYGYGRFTARGRIIDPGSAESRLDLRLALERSAISGVSALFAGQDIGLHGSVRSEARLTGPISDLELTGQLQFEDIYRWSLMPVGGREWPLNYHGRLDLRNQELRMETVTRGPAPITIRTRASNFLSEPRWALHATLAEAPAAGLLEIARQLGVHAVPDGVAVEGALSGVFGYSPSGGVQGQGVLSGGTARGQGFSFKVERAEVLIDGALMEITSARLVDGRGERTQLAATLDSRSGRFDLRLGTQGLAIDEAAALSAITGAAAPQLLRACRGGLMRGFLQLRRGGTGEQEWSGAFRVEGTEVAVPGLSVPVKVNGATAALRGERLTVREIRASAGGIEFGGAWSDLPGPNRSHRLQLVVEEADPARMEALLLPALQRRAGLLARALGRQAPLPASLSAMRLDGSIRIGRLTVGETVIEGIESPLRWNGAELELGDIRARLLGAAGGGRLRVSLRGSEPEYRLSARFQQVPWRGGRVDVEGTLEAAGTGSRFWRSLVSTGTVGARGVDLGEPGLKSVAACYDFTVSGGAPRVQISGLEVTVGPDTYYGQGGSQPDGSLRFPLASGRKQMQLAGTLAPLRLDLTAGR